MSLALWINDGGGFVDRSGFVAPDTLNIVDQLDGRNACTFKTRHKTNSYHGEIGQPIEVYDGATKIYAGLITDVQLGQFGNLVGFEYSYTCADYSTLTTRHIIAWNYEGMQADDIIIHINQYFLTGEGITAVKVGSGGHVEPGVFVDSAKFNYCTIFEAISQIAELCGYSWYVDYDKSLHFFAWGSKTAPFTLTDAQRNYATLTASQKISQYRNRQYIKGGQANSEARTEHFHGDSKIAAFDTMFPISITPTVTLNNVSQTLGINGVDVDKDWYWNKDSPTITQANPLVAITEDLLLKFDFNLVDNNLVNNGGSTEGSNLTLNNVDVYTGYGARYGRHKGSSTSYCVDGSAFRLPEDEFTIEWIGTVESTGETQYLMRHRDSLPNGWYINFVPLGPSNGLLTFFSGMVFISTITALPYDTLCHLSITYKKEAGQSNLKIYIGEALDNTATSTSSAGNPTLTVNLTVGYDHPTYYHKGKVYLARIYSKEHNAAQVRDNVYAERYRYQASSRGTRLKSTDTLRVNYQYGFPVLEMMEDTTKQAARAAVEGSGTGVYETIVEDATLNDTTITQDKAARFIEKYGLIPETIHFTTTHTVPGTPLRAGQVITVNLPELGLNDTYLINSVSLADQSFQQYVYTVESLSGESLSGWADFFLKLHGPFTVNPTSALILLKKISLAASVSVAMTETHGAPAHLADTAQVGFGECTS